MDVIVLVAFAALATLGLAASVSRPMRTIVPLYAATMPIASVVKLSVPLPSPFDTLSSFLGGMALAACAVHILVDRRGRIPGFAVGVWLVLLAWSTLTVLWAIDPATARTTAIVAASLILLMILVSMQPLDLGDLDALRVAIIISGIVVGAYGLFLLVTGSALPSHGASQRFSIASNPSDTDPNILAASLLMPLLLSVERILVGGKRWWSARSWRLFGVIGAFLSTVAIVITGSRGGLVAAFIGFVIVLVSCRGLPDARLMVRRVTTAIVTMILAVLVIAFAGSALNAGGPLGRIVSTDAIQRIFAVQNGSSGRFEIWRAGFLACRAECAAGAGLGNFPDAYNRAFAFAGSTKDVGANRPAHNIYLEMAVDTGFLGLGLLGLALLAEWRVVSRRRIHEEAPALKAILVAVLIANFFLSAIWFKYFFLVFLVIRVAEGATGEDELLRPSTVMAWRDRSLVTSPTPIYQERHPALDGGNHA